MTAGNTFDINIGAVPVLIGGVINCPCQINGSVEVPLFADLYIVVSRIIGVVWLVWEAVLIITDPVKICIGP